VKAIRTNIPLVIIILLTVLFIVGQIIQYDKLSAISRSLILPIATTIYFIKVKKRSTYFSLFLVIFSLSELIGILDGVVLPHTYIFYIVNSICILAYICLIIDILTRIKSSPDFKGFFTKYTVHAAVLVMFAVYLVVLLGEIMKPHLDTMEYTISMVYSSVIMTLLTVSLLNFICNDTKKAFLLFLASVCIVFSEIVQIAYYYLSETHLLSIIYSLLLVAAFCLFYKQGFLKKEANKNLNLFKA